MERGNEMRFAFEAKTHFPGAHFSVHPWWRRAPGKCVFVASNPEGISETRAPYTLERTLKVNLDVDIDILHSFS